MHELVIKNAVVCDGTGAPAFEGAVSVSGGKVTGMSTDLGDAARTVDAQGLVLAPGLVDIHTHYDAQITWDNSTRPSPEMGVTTVVMGNCGFGIVPCRPEDRELTLRNLTKVEGMPIDALLAGVQWDFESFGEYLDSIESRGVVANVAGFAAHSNIRLYVMGKGNTEREATPEEIAGMQDVLRDALKAGAIGLATSTAESHNGDGGIPMPSRFAGPDEFRALLETLGEVPGRVFQITKGKGPDIEFLEEIAKGRGCSVQVCPLLQDPGQPGFVFEEMDKVTAAQTRGVEIYGQVSPFPEILEFTIENPFLLESIQAWRPAMAAGGGEALAGVYRDESFRQSVKDELANAGAPFRFSNQWNTMTITKGHSDASRALEGRDVASIANERGVHPLDCMLDIGLADNLETRFKCVVFNADEQEVKKLLAHEYSVVGLGDAGAHLTFFCQAGSGLYLLQNFVRKNRDLKLEHAIQLLTSQPADAFRISNRGRIKVGGNADLFLFDPDEAGIGERCVVADLPGGIERIHTPALGVHGVWVNGEQVANTEGLLPDPPRAGQVLRA